MTQTDAIGGKHSSFGGTQQRPYHCLTAGSPKAKAKSGARSIDQWQRDYNDKGNIEEKMSSMRYQKVSKLKRQAVKEATRRMLPVEVVEEEMYQAQRTQEGTKRVDTGLPKDEPMITSPSRTVPMFGGPPKIFDGSETLEENFAMRDAQEMFRGEAWQLMCASLSKVQIDEFNPAPRTLDGRTGSPSRQGRGSFSFGVTPSELSKAVKDSNKKKDQWTLGADCVDSLKKLLIRKYGTIFAAWRHVLDPNGLGRISFAEWCSALRKMGFEGDIKAAWKNLDTDGSGIVSFKELEPELAANFADYAGKMQIMYGGGKLKSKDMNWDEAWPQIDTNGNNQVCAEEFAELCDSVGYKEDPNVIFVQLKFLPSRRFICLNDFKSMPCVTRLA